MQVSVSQLGRLDPADDSLQTKARVFEDDLDGLQAFGGSPRDRSAAVDKLRQVRTQRGMQMFLKPRDDAAAFAWRETQSRVCADGKLDAAADDLAIAAGMRPVPPLGQLVARRPDLGLHPGSEDRCQACRWRGLVVVRASLSIVLLPSHTQSKPQSSSLLNSPALTATCPH